MVGVLLGRSTQTHGVKSLRLSLRVSRCVKRVSVCRSFTVSTPTLSRPELRFRNEILWHDGVDVPPLTGGRGPMFRTLDRPFFPGAGG